MTTRETKYYADGRLFLHKPLKRIFHKMHNYENFYSKKCFVGPSKILNITVKVYRCFFW